MQQFYVANVVAVNPTFVTAYTVPAGDRIVLRSIAVRNLNGSGGVTWYVRLAGVVVFTGVLASGGTSGGSAEWRPWIVMTPGQKIELAVSATPGVGAVVSGSLYTI